MQEPAGNRVGKGHLAPFVSIRRDAEWPKFMSPFAFIEGRQLSMKFDEEPNGDQYDKCCIREGIEDAILESGRVVTLCARSTFRKAGIPRQVDQLSRVPLQRSTASRAQILPVAEFSVLLIATIQRVHGRGECRDSNSIQQSHRHDRLSNV